MFSEFYLHKERFLSNSLIYENLECYLNAKYFLILLLLIYYFYNFIKKVKNNKSW